MSSGNGEIHGTLVEREDTPSAPGPADSFNSSSSSLETANLKPRPPVKPLATHAKGSSNSHFKNSMNCRNDKPPELKICESKSESTALPNGSVLLQPGLYANGYPTKPALDSGGSGFESGYITPKKRWAQRSARAEQSVTGQEKAMLHAAMVPNKRESEPQTPEPDKILTGSQSLTFIKGVPPVDQLGELQCKNSEGKASAGSVKKLEDRSGKAKVISSKDDSWTLFKPPPVFPVDNSSAKTVPKISYASKVKENLNKAAVQVAEDILPPQSQVPTKLSQVPMSAVKTITSPSFTNGPLSGEGINCPLPAPLFTTTACPAPTHVSPFNKGENEASSPSHSTNTPGAPSMTTRELKNPSFLAPSNMQSALPSARQLDTSATNTSPKALVDIFQNQWGLSFINEPSAGPGAGVAVVGPPARKGQIMEITFQGGGPAALPLQISATSTLRPDKPLFPKVNEQDKQTISHSSNSIGKTCPLLNPSPDGLRGHNPDPDIQKDEPGSSAARVVTSSKGPGAELPVASFDHPVAKEPSHSKGCEPRSGWGAFDLRAAVIYHIKEVEYIWNLQKQGKLHVIVLELYIFKKCYIYFLFKSGFS
uniref:Nuclear FMR1 interacting protein 2 n=1 Tax=Esox lucius TaxID=8010 RepID=A0A3P9A7J2_ESOLU